MEVHVFRKQSGWKKAITLDQLGNNLPNDGQPWIYEKQMNIVATDGPRIGASSKDIIDGIEADGVFVWPSKSDA